MKAIKSSGGVVKFYIGITIQPNADIGHYFLWEKVFQQIHLGLVEIQDTNNVVPVGIAFPEYDAKNFSLGSKLRLFSETENLLQQFDANKWLSRLKDYAQITPILKVPDKINAFSCYSRQQSKSSIERMARRRAKKKSVNFEVALEELQNRENKNRKNQDLEIPFINMQSLSSKKNSNSPALRFRLFIEKQTVDTPLSKGFNSYGLSAVSTVPEF